MFKSVLIANRGEIAVRIARTLRTIGIRSVVVASIPDRHSLAVRRADDWVLLEGSSAADSYLDVEAIIGAAKAKGCEAIHPGYGFLSERADFAERCAADGITFIGPSPSALRALGDKSSARQLALASGVPVVPGYDGPDDDPTLIREAAAIGLPLLVKARGGGGGRGMREVHDLNDLPEAIESARREAASAFGDPGLLLEKLVTRAHHVEVQVLADGHGNVIHLGERDCSVQRRRQKLIEESPSPVVDDALRARLTECAIRLARAAGYTNAGTVEFLVTEPGPSGVRDFYFLEVNPRLQVEHPVTEMVTGLDLVELQLRIAAGEALPVTQDQVTFTGHAIEFRINAEDPWDDFRPGTGRLLAEPGCLHRADRTDQGFEEGDVVPPQYDSLIAKVLVYGDHREEAIGRSSFVFAGVAPAGVPTNAGLHAAIIASDGFRDGPATAWLEESLAELCESVAPPSEMVAASAATFVLGQCSPWGAAGASAWLADAVTGHATRVLLTAWDGAHVRCEVGGATIDLALRTPLAGTIVWAPSGHEGNIFCTREGTTVLAVTESTSLSHVFSMVPPPPLPRRAAAATEGATAITAPLSGTVSAVRVAAGDLVEVGQVLLLLEAMKMEHRIVATTPGTVARVAVRETDAVREGDVLIELA